MKGIMISNGFLRGEKFAQPARMLSDAAAAMGIGLRTMSNSDLVFGIGDSEACRRIIGDADFILFWDKDVRLASNLELCGLNVFNNSECIRICDDKSETHLRLARAGVPMIPTTVCPLSFSGYDDLGFLADAAERIGFPMVVKDCFGSFGEQVRLARDMAELEASVSGPFVPRILQRYIEASATDIRAEVVGGEMVACVSRRGPEGDFRSNCTIGGTMEEFDAPSDIRDLAVSAAEAVGADFCGVDIIMDGDEPLVCEVNSNAHIMNLLNCTGHDVSYDILRHIRERL